MEFETIVFNEGEPLDVDKLNKIQSNSANIYKQTSQIYNATVGSGASTQSAPYVPVMNCGYVEFPKVTANQVIAANFDYGKTIFSEIPFVTASVRTRISDKEQISVSVINLGGQPQIQVMSNMAHTNLRVDWIAMAKKPIVTT